MTTRTTTQLLAALACTTALGSTQADIITVDRTDHVTVRYATATTATTETGMHPKNEAGTNADRYLLLRFDSSDFGSDVTAATLNMVAQTWPTNTGTDFTFYFFGVKELTLPDSYDDELFSQGTYTPNNSDSIYDGSNLSATSNLIDVSQTVVLGSATFSKDDSPYGFSSAALLSFIQADTNGTVTIAVTRDASPDGNSTFNVGTNLVIDVVPEPGSLALMGLGGLMMVKRRRRA